MKPNLSNVSPSFLVGAGLLLLVGLAGCTVSDGAMPSTTAMPAQKPTIAKETPDSIVGKWKMYPAIGPTSRSCSVEFQKSAFDPHKGRVSTFACNQVEGLGSINGVSRITQWERKGRTIILSGIASPNIGTLDLPVDSFSDRVYGSTRDDIRFVIVRN